MGKRNKRLTMAKYAKKYATVRDLIAEKRQPEQTLEPELEIPAVEQVIKEPTPVLEAAQEEIEDAPEPVVEPEPEPLVVEPEPVIEEAPEPPKPKTRAKRKPRKTTTSKKLESPVQSE